MESMEKKNPRKEEEASRQPLSLTDDLVMEILVRLPFRSLARFQCVSKSWRSLTSDARKKLPRRPHGFFHVAFYHPNAGEKDGIHFVNMLEEAASDVDPTLSFLPPSIHLEDVDVCNGLVLGRLDGSSSSRYAVLNPATRKYAMLPPYNVGSLTGSSSLDQMCWLAFDPDFSICYKVLSIVSLDLTPSGRPPYAYQVAIFSSKDRVWVVAEDPIELDSPIHQRQCHVFFNGVLYFLLTGRSTILGFNLQGKVCQRLELPIQDLDLLYSYWGMCFEVSGGCLRIAGIVNDEMVVWELEDIQTNKWVFKYTVNVHTMEEKLPTFAFEYPKFILQSFHFDADAILLIAGGALFRYDLSTTNMTEVCVFRDESQKWYTKNVFYPYTPYYSEDLVLNSEEDAELWISSEVNTS